MERRRDPRRPVERSEVTLASPERRERNTSPRQAESAAQPPRDQLFLRPQKATMVSQMESRRLKPAARVAGLPPAKRQSHGNPLRSTARWAATKAVAAHQESIARWAKRESRTSRADDPKQRLAAPLREACQGRHEDQSQASARPASMQTASTQTASARPAPPSRRASPLPAAPQKNRSPDAQSLPDREPPPSRPTRRHTSAHFPARKTMRKMKMKAMSASRSLRDHLYS